MKLTESENELYEHCKLVRVSGMGRIEGLALTKSCVDPLEGKVDPVGDLCVVEEVDVRR